MKNSDLHWLAGFLEGEGSFLKGPPSCSNLPIVQAVTTDEDVIYRVSQLFNTKHMEVCKERNIVNGWKPAYTVRLKGKKAVRLMKKLLPLMGERRQQQIQKAISSYDPKITSLDDNDVRKIKKLLKKGLFQREIAKKFKIRRETVNKINRGKVWNNIDV